MHRQTRYNNSTVKPVTNRNSAGSDIHDHFRNEIGIETGGTISRIKFFQLFFKSSDTAIARGPDHTDIIEIFLLHRRGEQSGISERLVTGHHGVEGKEIIFFDFFFLKKIFWMKSFHFTTKPRLEFGRIKFCYGSGTTFTLYDVFPEFIDSISQRSE